MEILEIILLGIIMLFLVGVAILLAVKIYKACKILDDKKKGKILDDKKKADLILQLDRLADLKARKAIEESNLLDLKNHRNYYIKGTMLPPGNINDLSEIIEHEIKNKDIVPEELRIDGMDYFESILWMGVSDSLISDPESSNSTYGGSGHGGDFGGGGASGSWDSGSDSSSSYDSGSNYDSGSSDSSSSDSGSSD